MTPFTYRSFSKQWAVVIVGLIFSAVSAALPVGVLAAPGDLYVTNLATNTVDVYSPAGEKSTFASGLDSPQGLVFDQSHNLYVADAGSGSIFRYDTAGNQTTFYSGLAAPVGLAIEGDRLLVAESDLNRIVSLRLDQSAGLKVVLTRDDPILGVAVGGATRYVTYGTVMNSLSTRSSTFYFFVANTQGVTTVRRPGLGRFDVYVTTDDGDIWLIDPSTTTRRLFASGLNDPNGMDFLPARLSGGNGGELYTADRGAGEILSYATDGTPSVFVSDAGIPNFLAFELE
jgi:sugar lactone lactonase YvrE